MITFLVTLWKHDGNIGSIELVDVPDSKSILFAARTAEARAKDNASLKFNCVVTDWAVLSSQKLNFMPQSEEEMWMVCTGKYSQRPAVGGQLELSHQ